MRGLFRSGDLGIEHVRELLDALPVPMFVARVDDDRIVAVNEAACELLGHGADELKQRTIDDITADDHVSSRRWLDRALVGDRVVAEPRYVRRDGTVVHGRTHAVPLTPDGALVAFVVFDATEYHAAAHHARTLVRVAELAQHASPEVDDFVVQLRSTLREQLGVDAEVEWAGEDLRPSSSTSRATSGPDRAASSRGDHLVQPISVMGRRVGTLRLGFPPGQRISREDRRMAAVLSSIVGAASAMTELTGALRNARLFEAGFERSRVGMQVLDPEGTFLRVNEAFAEMLGRPVDELVGMNWRDVTSYLDVRDREAITEELISGRQPRHHELKRYRRADGSEMWGDLTVTAVFPDGPDRLDTRVHLSQVVDVSDQVEALHREREMRAALEASERRYRSLVEPAPDAVLRVSADGRILDANRTALAMIGGTRTEVVDRALDRVLPRATASAIASRTTDVIRTRSPAEVWRHWVEPADRNPGWYLLRVVPEDGAVTESVDVVYVVASEITELVENEQRLESMALIDPLTATANRAAIFDRLQHALDRLRRASHSGVAVAVCDLDHFKAINDTYGHAVGDDALRRVAHELTMAVRPHDTVGRLGGDEFIIIFEDVSDHETADELGRRIGEALRAATVERPDGHPMALNGSVGVAWTTSPVELVDLVARADRAMYEAKRHGRGRTWAEVGSVGDRRGSDASMLRDLQAALDREQFVVRYQPIVDTSTERMVAVEALLRWNHPDGMRLPSVFLGPLLESGRIGPVGQWAMRSAIRQLAAWRAGADTAELTLHLNASPAELASPQYAISLSSVLDETGVPPDAVTIELTEQALAGTIVSSSAIAEVASLGVRIVLDDFGTGVSSLAHLRARPLHGIKIDRSFVAGASQDETDRRIASGIVALAGSLELDVIAEGVETADQAGWLDRLGCRLQQGWRYSRALSADAVVEAARRPLSGAEGSVHAWSPDADTAPSPDGPSAGSGADGEATGRR